MEAAAGADLLKSLLEQESKRQEAKKERAFKMQDSAIDSMKEANVLGVTKQNEAFKNMMDTYARALT